MYSRICIKISTIVPYYKKNCVLKLKNIIGTYFVFILIKSLRYEM